MVDSRCSVRLQRRFLPTARRRTLQLEEAAPPPLDTSRTTTPGQWCRWGAPVRHQSELPNAVRARSATHGTGTRYTELAERLSTLRTALGDSLAMPPATFTRHQHSGPPARPAAGGTGKSSWTDRSGDNSPPRQTTLTGWDETLVCAMGARAEPTGKFQHRRTALEFSSYEAQVLA